MASAAEKRAELDRQRAAQDEQYAAILAKLATAPIDDDPAGTLTDVLMMVADSFSAEGQRIEAAKAKGHVTAKREWTDAAMKVRGLATQIEAFAARTGWSVGKLAEAVAEASPVPTIPEGPSGSASADLEAFRAAAGYAEPAPLDPSLTYGVTSASFREPLWQDPEHWSAEPAGSATSPPSLGPNPHRPPVGQIVAPPLTGIATPEGQAAFLAERAAGQTPAEDASEVTEAVNPFTAPKAPGRVVSRLSFPAVVAHLAELGNSHGAAPESSYSQVRDLSGCGMAYGLKRLSRHAYIGAERPSWSLIGGNAFDGAVIAFEQAETEPDDAGLDEIWRAAFEAEVAKALDKAGAYRDLRTWHAADGGKEGYDWWRVEGAGMLRSYVEHHSGDWLEKWKLSALQWEYRLDIDGVTSHGYADQIWESVAGEVLVLDDKTGKRTPPDPFQIAEYAHAASRIMTIEPAMVRVGYFNARKGERRIFEDPFRLVPWEALAYRHSAARALKLSGAFLPNVTDMCGGCSVLDYCPAQTMRDAA